LILTSPILIALRRLSAPDRFADSLRVLLALGGVMLFCGLAGRMDMMIPLLLGVIAAALAETDDGWRKRVHALVGTLVCFSIGAFTVQLLFAWPWPFALTLAAGSFVLVMLGAASPRYATITNATLLLSVYTMIGMDQHSASAHAFWREPALLVAGAAWYGLLAIVWSAVFLQQPVRLALARLYASLGEYLAVKARLFEPVQDLPVAERRAELAQCNQHVVAALNACRLTLIDRLDRRHPHPALNRALTLYLAAQDIHERASSSHYPYAQLARSFFHSDVLFRCQRVMQSLAGDCRARAAAARLGEPYRDAGRSGIALAELRAALEHRRHLQDPPPAELMQALDRLLLNVTRLHARIRCAEADPPQGEDNALQNPSPDSLREAWGRVRLQLTPTSARFRHALRLGLAMLAGYGVLRWVHPEQGYWILLTVMLVCQPDFGATRTRVLQRVVGTVLGLVTGWALLKLFPATPAQLALTVVAGVLFFVARYRKYLAASAAVTVLVLLAFNQVGNGFELIWPRLLDTLIGGALAVAATFLVLPDWRERELRLLFARTLEADAAYLQQILAQYGSGKRDDLPYRIARRDAQDADATLSAHLSSALSDAAGQRLDDEHALRLLAASQELIGHLSALGAHRQVLPAEPGNLRLVDTGMALADHLHAMAASLRAQSGVPQDPPAQIDVPHGNEVQDLMAAQLGLVHAQLPALGERARHLLQARA
jgi:YccS/YhfK family integral membrane protein